MDHIIFDAFLSYCKSTSIYYLATFATYFEVI